MKVFESLAEANHLAFQVHGHKGTHSTHLSCTLRLLDKSKQISRVSTTTLYIANFVMTRMESSTSELELDYNCVVYETTHQNVDE
jgi:hypothetical protein